MIKKIYNSEQFLLILFAIINFSHIVDFMVMMPLGPSFMRVFDINPQQFGFLISAYAFCAGISGLLAALYIDRFDRKKALMFFYGGFVIGTFLCAIANSYVTLFLARSLTGAFGGILMSVILAIISDLIPYSRRGYAMGIIATGFSLASIFGVPFGLYIAQEFTWNAPFLFLGVLSVGLFFLTHFRVPPMAEHIRTKSRLPFDVAKELFTDKPQLIGLLFMSCVVFGQFTVIPFISPSLVLNAGLLESQLPLVYLAGGLCSMISGPVVGKVSDRFGKRGAFVTMAIFSIIPIYLITNLAVSPVPTIIFFTSMLFIGISGRMVPAMTMVSSSAPTEKRGSYMSFVSATQQFSAAMAAAIAGFIIVESETKALLNFEKVGFIAIAFSVVAIILSMKVRTLEDEKGIPDA